MNIAKILRQVTEIQRTKGYTYFIFPGKISSESITGSGEYYKYYYSIYHECDSDLKYDIYPCYTKGMLEEVLRELKKEGKDIIRVDVQAERYNYGEISSKDIRKPHIGTVWVTENRKKWNEIDEDEFPLPGEEWE